MECLASSQKITLAQINLHHSRSASALLSKMLMEGKVDIALIQEPWTRDGNILGLGSAKHRLFYDKTCDRPRACIYVNQRLNALNLVKYLSKDNVAVKLNYLEGKDKREIFLSSSYLPYEDKDPLSFEAKELIGFCVNNNKKLIFGCDANAHHIVWGSSDCNKRGEDLLEFILRHNLYILNRGNEPTFVTVNRREVIDLTMCSSNCYEHIKDWYVSDEVTLSDHRLIIFTLAGRKVSVRVKRNPKKTNWDSYLNSLKNYLQEIKGRFDSPYDLELAVDTVQRSILQSYWSNCPCAETSSPRLVPWWNSELSKLRKSTRRLFNRAKKTGDWQNYRSALTKYNKAIRDAKRISWKSFCDGINDTSAMAKITKIMIKDRNSNLNTIKLPDGHFTESSSETLSEMMRVHFPHSSCADNDPFTIPEQFCCDRKGWDTVNKIVTYDKVGWAIDTFSPYKTPGMDEIIPILLQKGKDILIPVISKIYRACLAFGYVPKAWRYTKVIFIPKPGKDSYYDPKSFRPISLTSFLLKILEKLVDRHIRESILVEKPLSTSQHAYQPGKSCETALYELTHSLDSSLRAKEVALATFLDIEGAFDKVPINSIMRALHKRDANTIIIDWINCLLSDRIISATLMDDTVQIKAKAGCPQGGVLSPILWCLVVDTLLDDICTSGATCIGYADDVAIIVRGKFEGVLCDILNNILKKVEVWCGREGLSVNPDKTNLVTFTNRRVLKLKTVSFYGQSLNFSKDVKYLGVFFDTKLSWKRHQDYCISKAKKIFWSCRNAIGKTWGLNPRVVQWIYSMIICPVITYGAIAWWSRIKVEQARNDLTKLQRLICVATSGALKTTPTGALELLLDMHPLHMRIEAEALITVYRLRCLGYWRSYSRYLSWKDLNSEILGHRIYCMISDEVPLRYVFDIPFKVYFPTRHDWSSDSVVMNGSTWYTDGSKMATGSGAGVCCQMEDEKYFYPLGKHSTVFQAEVFAILMCSNLCINRGYNNACINICSDSQAALLALQKHTITSGIVWDCYSALCKLAGHGCNKVCLFWVPGHTGISGNDMADELAREGSMTPFIGPEPAIGVSKVHVRDTIFRILRKQQYQIWLKSTGQRQSKELNRCCPSVRAKELFKLSRNSMRKAIGLLTGHSGLMRHLHIMGVVNDPVCRGCRLEEETVSHVLCDCETFAAHRFEHLGRHLIEPWEIQDIPVKCLLNFISATGLLKD